MGKGIVFLDVLRSEMEGMSSFFIANRGGENRGERAVGKLLGLDIHNFREKIRQKLLFVKNIKKNSSLNPQSYKVYGLLL